MDYRGKGYPVNFIKEAQNLLHLKRIFPGNRNLSYTGIANFVGVRSHNTIKKWDSNAMDDVSIMQRRLKKGHNRKLSDYDELIIAGWIIDENKKHNPTRTFDVLEFILKFFFVLVDDSWISRFQERQHLSHNIPSKILKYESKSNALDIIVNYITQLRKKLNGKQANQVNYFHFQSEFK